MSRVDKINQEIGWFKVIFAILVATEISLLAWLVQNFGRAGSVLQVIAALVAIFDRRRRSLNQSDRVS